MPKLPEIRPKDIEKVLLKLGINSKPGKGSHVTFRHSDGHRTVVPGHNQPLRHGTLRAILKQANLTPAEFLTLLKK